MISYLHTFEEAKERIISLREHYDKRVVTGLECANAFYGALDDIQDYDKVPTEEIEKLMDCVHKLPSEIQRLLSPMLSAQTLSGNEPITGVAFRMPEDEQRQRIPHKRMVTEGLLKRLKHGEQMG